MGEVIDDHDEDIGMDILQEKTVTKNKGGRPKKDKIGRNLFVPAECLDVVVALIEVTRRKRHI